MRKLGIIILVGISFIGWASAILRQNVLLGGTYTLFCKKFKVKYVDLPKICNGSTYAKVLFSLKKYYIIQNTTKMILKDDPGGCYDASTQTYVMEFVEGEYPIYSRCKTAGFNADQLNMCLGEDIKESKNTAVLKEKTLNLKQHAATKEPFILCDAILNGKKIRVEVYKDRTHAYKTGDENNMVKHKSDLKSTLSTKSTSPTTPKGRHTTPSSSLTKRLSTDKGKNDNSNQNEGDSDTTAVRTEGMGEEDGLNGFIETFTETNGKSVAIIISVIILILLLAIVAALVWWFFYKKKAKHTIVKVKKKTLEGLENRSKVALNENERTGDKTKSLDEANPKA
ncbi:hypothetical protein SNEBB_002644 [Seison nebaliae]|nr:hypothetical protein SNEBB_002644 [Seison nebaliae]